MIPRNPLNRPVASPIGCPCLLKGATIRCPAGSVHTPLVFRRPSLLIPWGRGVGFEVKGEVGAGGGCVDRDEVGIGGCGVGFEVKGEVSAGGECVDKDGVGIGGRGVGFEVKGGVGAGVLQLSLFSPSHPSAGAASPLPHSPLSFLSASLTIGEHNYGGELSGGRSESLVEADLRATVEADLRARRSTLPFERWWLLHFF
ncbi:uncharacterized protein G2W53_016707 [Senna tora]|uniref:Uncharacterized protein n=1 Tax=Senna tora TaxID=362788 RepID=A0A834WLR8_9FABA|nr:uncharacterized protein G2W53_016707 [Senna tora]